jgi:hypothetical protein
MRIELQRKANQSFPGVAQRQTPVNSTVPFTSVTADHPPLVLRDARACIFLRAYLSHLSLVRLDCVAQSSSEV